MVQRKMVFCAFSVTLILIDDISKDFIITVTVDFLLAQST